MTNDSSTPEQLATALGVPLFTTDLFVPKYREGVHGRWKITYSRFGLDRGYCSHLWAVRDMPILLRRVDGSPPSWETWMSISPHEIESQYLSCRHASGHTVVMGLGMGWITVNIARNPAVQRVTVVERDPEVIALFNKSGPLEELSVEILDKIQVIQADALHWRAKTHVNFLSVDIWANIAEAHALDDVRRMQDNVCADTIYFWGQELIIHDEAAKLPGASDPPALDAQLLHSCVVDSIGLPLLLPQEIDYPLMIQNVMRQRRARSHDCRSNV